MKLSLQFLKLEVLVYASSLYGILSFVSMFMLLFYFICTVVVVSIQVSKDLDFS